MTPNGSSGNGRWHRRHHYPQRTPAQRRWHDFFNVIKGPLGAALFGVLVATGAFTWSVTPPPASAAISQYVTLETMRLGPQHRYIQSTPVSSDGILELVVDQPQDAYFAPDAWESSPYGWYGRAVCSLIAYNIFGHQVLAFGVAADFIGLHNGINAQKLDQPLVSTATGWHVQPSPNTQLAFDSQARVYWTTATAEVTLFNQAGAPLRDYVFAVHLAIGFNGVFSCSVDTTILSAGPPLI